MTRVSLSAGRLRGGRSIWSDASRVVAGFDGDGFEAGIGDAKGGFGGMNPGSDERRSQGLGGKIDSTGSYVMIAGAYGILAITGFGGDSGLEGGRSGFGAAGTGGQGLSVSGEHLPVPGGYHGVASAVPRHAGAGVPVEGVVVEVLGDLGVCRAGLPEAAQG